MESIKSFFGFKKKTVQPKDMQNTSSPIIKVSNSSPFGDLLKGIDITKKNTNQQNNETNQKGKYNQICNSADDHPEHENIQLTNQNISLNPDSLDNESDIRDSYDNLDRPFTDKEDMYNSQIVPSDMDIHRDSPLTFKTEMVNQDLLKDLGQNDFFENEAKQSNDRIKSATASNKNIKPKKSNNKADIDLHECMKKFKKCAYAVLAIAKLNQILNQTKLYGTSSNLFNINYRSRDAVKRALYPDNKKVKKGANSAETPCGLINPNSAVGMTWNVFMILLIFYCVTVMPYGMVFQPDNKTKETFEEVMNFFFIIDIIVNFNLCYYDDENILVTSRSKIACKFLKGFFIIDFVSSIPFTLITGGGGGGANKIVRILKIPRLIKMMKLTKMKKFKEMYEGSALSYYVRTKSGLLKTIGLGFATLIILHQGACGWTAIGKLDVFIPDTWIWRYGMQDASNWDLYLTSIYFCFVSLTTVGYGDIYAFSTIEICFMIFWMLFGVGFYSFTVVVVSTFFSGQDTKQSLCHKRIIKLEEFCKEMNLEIKVQDEIKHALAYSSDKITYNWLDQSQDIFNEFPMRLKYEFLVALYGEVILECPFFNNYDISFVIRIVPLLKPIKYKAGEDIFKCDDFASAIIFLVSGHVNFIMAYNNNDKDSEEEKEIENHLTPRELLMSGLANLAKVKKDTPTEYAFKTMKNGSYFGETDIMLRRRRTCNVKAHTDCDAFILTRTVFENVVMCEYPHVYRELKKIANEKEKVDKKFLEDKIIEIVNKKRVEAKERKENNQYNSIIRKNIDYTNSLFAKSNEGDKDSIHKKDEQDEKLLTENNEEVESSLQIESEKQNKNSRTLSGQALIKGTTIDIMNDVKKNMKHNVMNQDEKEFTELEDLEDIFQNNISTFPMDDMLDQVINEDNSYEESVSCDFDDVKSIGMNKIYNTLKNVNQSLKDRNLMKFEVEDDTIKKGTIVSKIKKTLIDNEISSNKRKTKLLMKMNTEIGHLNKENENIETEHLDKDNENSEDIDNKRTMVGSWGLSNTRFEDAGNRASYQDIMKIVENNAMALEQKMTSLVKDTGKEYYDCLRNKKLVNELNNIIDEGCLMIDMNEIISRNSKNSRKSKSSSDKD